MNEKYNESTLDGNHEYLEASTKKRIDELLNSFLHEQFDDLSTAIDRSDSDQFGEDIGLFIDDLSEKIRDNSALSDETIDKLLGVMESSEGLDGNASKNIDTIESTIEKKIDLLYRNMIVTLYNSGREYYGLLLQEEATLNKQLTEQYVNTALIDQAVAFWGEQGVGRVVQGLRSRDTTQ